VALIVRYIKCQQALLEGLGMIFEAKWNTNGNGESLLSKESQGTG